MSDAFPVHDLLDAIKEFLADERFMSAYVQFAAVHEWAIVDWVPEQSKNLGTRKRNTDPFALIRRGQPCSPHCVGSMIERASTLRIHFKQLPNHRAANGVRDDGSSVAVILITNGSDVRPNSPLELLTLAAFDIFRKTVDIVFALAEHDGEHELSRRRGIEDERREFKIDDLTGIHKVNDATAVYAVASQTVRMPRENTSGFSAFNALNHLIEYRSAWNFGGLPFDEDVSDS